MSVHLSIHMEKLGSHWTDFYEIWYLSLFILFQLMHTFARFESYHFTLILRTLKNTLTR